mmetsp:Transcript_6004/g.18363  ORF Transcript_6004/g.18363 Transcript_6004/m.18363 type:complete len:219 (-) Transcript_6004:539-1195(-)
MFHTHTHTHTSGYTPSLSPRRTQILTENQNCELCCGGLASCEVLSTVLYLSTQRTRMNSVVGLTRARRKARRPARRRPQTERRCPRNEDGRAHASAVVPRQRRPPFRPGWCHSRPGWPPGSRRTWYAQPLDPYTPAPSAPAPGRELPARAHHTGSCCESGSFASTRSRTGLRTCRSCDCSPRCAPGTLRSRDSGVCSWPAGRKWDRCGRAPGPGTAGT